MVSKKCMLVFVLSSAVAAAALPAENQKLKERKFEACFLYEADGRTWLRQPMVHLGMVGVVDTSPFSLSEELARQFAPLISRVAIKDDPPHRSFYTWGMPRFRDNKGNLILLWLEAKMRLVGAAPGAPSEGPSREFHEIVGVRLIAAECVTNDWIQGWEKLSAALEEIVLGSLTSPSSQKRKHLAEAVEKGSEALNTISTIEPNDAFRAILSRIEPNAALVRTFQQRVADEWRDQFEKYIIRLQIKPQTPLPPRPGKWSALELLAESNSPAEFTARMKKFLPEADVDKFSTTEFEQMRSEAKKLLAERKERERKHPWQQKTEAVEQWGALLRPVGDEVLAEKLILRGALVEKIVSDKQNIGFIPGDIIIDYQSLYDMVMGDFAFDRCMRQLAQRLQREQKLRVLRGSEVIAVDVDGKQ